MNPPAKRVGAIDVIGVLVTITASAFGAFGIENATRAAADEGTIRVVGLGAAGPMRALDVLIGSIAMLLPFGTRVLRAGLACALVAGASAWLIFVLARRVAEAALRGRKAASSWLVPAASAVAALTAILGPAWHAEATLAGGSVTGAALVLLALVLASDEAPNGVALSLVVGLAASYEPFVLAGTLAASGPVAYEALRRRPKDPKDPTATRLVARVLPSVLAFLLGLAPLAIGFARTARAAYSDPTATLARSLFERAPAKTSLALFATTQIGGVVLGAAALGVASFFVPRKGEGPTSTDRRYARSLLAVIGVAIAAIILGAPAGPGRISAIILAGVAAVHVVAAGGLAAVVVLVASAPVPLAGASAALVVLLELVLPIRAADESIGRREARAPRAASIWTEAAWGPLPPGAVVLVADRGTMRRIEASRAAGEMRGDLVVAPLYDLRSRAAHRALAAEPKLAGIYRDVALGSPPEELSFTQLSSQRAVIAVFDGAWDRSLSRHLVPVGLSSRFEPEPRGASDRKQALDAFVPAKDRLVRVSVAKKDPELAAATATLLRARAVGMAAAGERDILARALDDLRSFAPDDPVASQLVRRTVTTKGAIDVRDL